MGRKKLFILERGSYLEMNPHCMLDFYVHESNQRMGIGRHLFDTFLNAEDLSAQNIAYDRPSSKLLSFLYKHYGKASHLSLL